MASQNHKQQDALTAFKKAAVPAALVGTAAAAYGGPEALAIAGVVAAGGIAAGIAMSNKHVKADRIRALDRSVTELSPLETLERAAYYTKAYTKAAERHGKLAEDAAKVADKLAEDQAKRLEKREQSGHEPSKFQIRRDELRLTRIESLDSSAELSGINRMAALGSAQLHKADARRALEAIRELPSKDQPSARQLRRLGAADPTLGLAKDKGKHKG